MRMILKEANGAQGRKGLPRQDRDADFLHLSNRKIDTDFNVYDTIKKT